MRKFLAVFAMVSLFSAFGAVCAETPVTAPAKPQELTPEEKATKARAEAIFGSEKSYQWNSGYRIVPGMGAHEHGILKGPDGIIGNIREDGSITEKIRGKDVIGHIDDYKQYFPPKTGESGYAIVPRMGRRGYDLLMGPEGAIGTIMWDGRISDPMNGEKIVGHMDDYKQFFPAGNWR